MDRPMMTSRDRRAQPRFLRAATGWHSAVLVRPGREARLVDISDAGALIELDTPLRPGANVHLQLVACGARVGARGHVTRCYVASLYAAGVQYRAAIAFDVCLSTMNVGGNGYQLPGLGTHDAFADGQSLPSDGICRELVNELTARIT